VRLRGNMQFIQTLTGTHPRDMPIDERLFMGGESSLRGYRFNTVGPKFDDHYHSNRGGMSSILLSADYNQYLFKKLDAFVFFDAGNAYWKQLYLGQLRYTAGYGLKLKVLGNAPIILGIGHPLNPQHKRDVKHFFVSLGTAF
jgi:outer membrane protein insertion porin family